MVINAFGYYPLLTIYARIWKPVYNEDSLRVCSARYKKGLARFM